jgi:hypothetical protein
MIILGSVRGFATSRNVYGLFGNRSKPNPLSASPMMGNVIAMKVETEILLNPNLAYWITELSFDG